jgi:hypothetical protein
MGRYLSGGEQQNALHWPSRPKFLLFDEPSQEALINVDIVVALVRLKD